MDYCAPRKNGDISDDRYIAAKLRYLKSDVRNKDSDNAEYADYVCVR